MRNTPKWQRCEIGQRLTRASVFEPPSASRASKSCDDLEVDQLRRGQLLST